MLRRHVRGFAIVGLIVMGFAPLSDATPSITFYEDWTAAGTAGWVNTSPIGSGIAALSNPGGAGGYLQIRFPARGGPPPPPTAEEDVIYNTGAAYTGNFTNAPGLGVRFNFDAVDMLPSSLQLYMRAASGREWLYGFDVAEVGVWQTFEALFNFNYGHGWSGGTEAQFNSDIASISAIGILIESAVDLGKQDYGLDMWKYFIPEPATWCLLAAALLSAGIPLRRRRGERGTRNAECGKA